MCEMKNITLSIPYDILIKSREYAAKHGTSLNKLVRSFLQSTIAPDRKGKLNSLFEHMDKTKVKTNKKWTRD
jgi:hypothetical protein